MPTHPLMTWIPSQRTWTKRYLNKRYYISCRQLGIKPETKEASLQAANRWWRDRQADLDYAEKVKIAQQWRQPLPMEDLAAANLGAPSDLFGDVRQMLEQALLNEEERRKAGEPLPKAFPGLPDDAPADILIDDDEPEDAETIRRREVMALLERLLFGDDAKLPQSVAEQLTPARVAQVERAAKELRGEPGADPERTVKAMVEQWLLAMRSQVSIGGITAYRYDVARRSLSHFAAFIGETANVSTINAESLEGFHNYSVSKIVEQQWSNYYAQQVFATARQWIGWLVERGTIPTPSNFKRRWRFGPTVKQVETWPLEDVRRAVGEAKGKLRLCLLLMLNTGATQKDVADLLDVEVNWRDGRIIRKRSKTSRLESVPVVNYKLWPSTIALLKEHRSGQGRVLLTVSGKPYVNRRVVDGKFRAVDGFGTLLRKLTDKLGIKRPLKQLRKTSATLLEKHTVALPSGELVNPYANCVSLFLGHSPRSMKDKHYTSPPQELFDSAVTWLGQQYGFVDA